MLHLLPNAPDFTRCDPVREYRLGPFHCVLVREPKAIGNRIVPTASQIEFIYAMVFMHDEGDVRLIVTSERTADPNLISSNIAMGGDADDSKSFLCIFRRDGSRENLGKFEGLENENVFSMIALELCVREFKLHGLTAQLLQGLVDGDHLAGVRTVQVQSNQEIPVEESSRYGEGAEDDAETGCDEEAVSEKWHPAEIVEEFRANGEIKNAAELQGRLDGFRLHALMRVIWELEHNSTGNLDDDLRSMVEEMRADGAVRSAFCVQQVINARQDARTISRFFELVEAEGVRLKRLQRQLYAAEAKDNSNDIRSILAEQIAIYGDVCPSPMTVDEFSEELITEKLDSLRELVEEARADGDVVQAAKIQEEIDGLGLWLIAAELQIYLYFPSRT